MKKESHFGIVVKIIEECISVRSTEAEFNTVTVRLTNFPNMTAFWNTELRSLIKADKHFRAAYCLYHQGDQ
jgi:hypothetical protein